MKQSGNASRNELAAEISHLKSHIGFWMRLVSNHVSHGFARKLLASDVTVAEWVVLREMYGMDAVTPSVLAEQIGMTRGAISKLIDRLLEKQMVTREECSDDRRFQSVALTAKGGRLVPKLAALADENDAEFFSALSGAERKELARLLQKLAKAKELRRLPTD
jgi:DNA-binding MarR family transcriptional regulator